MSGGQNYLLLAMDMAKVGGPLSVVKVCTSMVCIRKNIGKWVVPYRLWSFLHKFEHSMSTPYYFGLLLILWVTCVFTHTCFSPLSFLITFLDKNSKTHDWLLVYLPLWKMMEFVNWDDYSIPNIWNGKIKIKFQTTNQDLTGFDGDTMGIHQPVYSLFTH